MRSSTPGYERILARVVWPGRGRAGSCGRSRAVDPVSVDGFAGDFEGGLVVFGDYIGVVGVAALWSQACRWRGCRLGR